MQRVERGVPEPSESRGASERLEDMGAVLDEQDAEFVAERADFRQVDVRPSKPVHDEQDPYVAACQHRSQRLDRGAEAGIHRVEVEREPGRAHRIEDPGAFPLGIADVRREENLATPGLGSPGEEQPPRLSG